MYARLVFVLCSLWLSSVRGQVGCPYSRTVVPGDAKRYIEVVHGIPYERQCAPGTEFSKITCECSVSSAVPWSAGAPNVPMLDIGSMPTNRKSRKSKKAVFSYKPNLPAFDALANFEATKFDLIGMLSQKPLLDLFSSKYFLDAQVKQPKISEFNHIPSKGLTKLDTFPNSPVIKTQSKISEFNLLPPRGTTKLSLSSSPVIKTQILESKLTSPLLKQDFATLTSFLKKSKQRRTLHENSQLGVANIKGADSFTQGFMPTHRKYIEVVKKEPQTPLLDMPQTTLIEKPQTEPYIPLTETHHSPVLEKHHSTVLKKSQSTALEQPHSTALEKPQSDLNGQSSRGGSNTANMNLQTIKSDIASMDVQKREILRSLMKKLSALEAQTTSNSASNGQTSSHQDQPVLMQNSNVQQTRSSSNPSSFSSNPLSLLTNRKLSTGMRQMSSSSPYGMMFNSIAAKEGQSDAQEIMQDKITEMGGGYAMLGSPMIGANAEIRSQLASTVFENGPMGFYL